MSFLGAGLNHLLESREQILRVFLAFSDPEKAPVPSGYRSETFDADEGEIRITWPSNLSLQSVEDMKDWLELLKRRIARRAGEGSGQDG